MKYGFFRAACASPVITVADCVANAAATTKLAREAAAAGASLIVFPELGITGYTCGDLFLQQQLQQKAIAALEQIAFDTAGLQSVIIAGLPVAVSGALYNCAAVLFRGEILALIPKSYLPVYAEFYERRQFSPAPRIPRNRETVYLSSAHPSIPFGTDILISDRENPLFTLGIEICEDVWVPVSPSAHAVLGGATVIANLSASNEIIGKADYRRLLIIAHSAKICAGYIYADAANGESTTDMVFAAHNLIAENGTLLTESRLFTDGCTVADIDLERIAQERRKTTTFADSVTDAGKTAYRIIPVDLDSAAAPAKPAAAKLVLRTIDPFPFVPSDKTARTKRCQEVIDLQAQGLARRIRYLGGPAAVIGLSGGLDSTLALLVTIRAFKICGLDKKQIRAVTMPCFGTTDRTYRNAVSLAKHAGVTLLEIPIRDAVRQHFADIGHDEAVHDITYENSQARERTQVLMDIANTLNGIVIGTGDLSEQALGWATYNGDHMSMYGVNGSIPKTLVRYLVTWFADTADTESEQPVPLATVLRDILATPVSPELLPPADGAISQKTESIVGPYELHDFFLYYTLRYGFTPKKISWLAEQAFIVQQKARGYEPAYTKATIQKWQQIFYRRFFSQQFKRNCMPEGAKIGTVNLNPRGDWRMPGDASAAGWLSDIGMD
jgi:NAD+ synthase (glutamine-hydrolysing)